MPTIYYTLGLPGSGKTTEAKELQTQLGPENCVRVNKDDLRAMLHSGAPWSKTLEEQVIIQQNALIRAALQQDKHVIVDDTNLDPRHPGRFKAIAGEMGAKLKVIDLRHVPLETCLKQNQSPERIAAGRVVPDTFIRKMHLKYIWSGDTVPNPDYSQVKQNAAIIDIDGTVAFNNGHRDYYDEAHVFDDLPRRIVIDVVTSFVKNHNIYPIFVSGRSDACDKETDRWILKHFPDMGPYDLRMRKAGDLRPDEVVKKEIYDTMIKPDFHVVAVFDDRPKVIQMWQELGLMVFNVGLFGRDF